MRNVLLAVDGSTSSDEAARLLAHFPHSERVQLTVLSIVQRPYVHSNYATSELLEKAYERDKAFAQQNFTAVEQMFDGANVTLTHEIKDGPVGEAIVETARKMEADLIVVGAKGQSQVARMLLGSVSDHVATHAACSTLVVRDTGLSGGNRPIRVCLAYEGSGSAVAALEEISEIPWRTGTEFHLLTVATYLSDFIGERTESGDFDTTEHYETDLAQARQRISGVAPKAKTHLVRTDHIGEGIVDFIEKNDIDLVVLGETRRGVLDRFLMGSTSRFVLRHAPCSVWITRNQVTAGESKQSSGRQAVGR